jgi:hypothetical protein
MRVGERGGGGRSEQTVRTVQDALGRSETTVNDEKEDS